MADAESEEQKVDGKRDEKETDESEQSDVEEGHSKDGFFSNVFGAKPKVSIAAIL